MSGGTDIAPLLREDDQENWRRHPGDVARLVFRSAVLLFLLAVSALAPAALRDLSGDIVEVVANLAPTLRDALVGIAQIATFSVPLAVVVWLGLRRSWSQAALTVGAGLAGAVLMALLVDWLDRAAPVEPITDLPSDWIVASQFPSISFVAGVVAGAAVSSPLLNQSWRRVAWVAVATAAAARLLTATEAPVNLAVALALGATVGSAALVAVGAPRRRPGATSLRNAFAEAGLEIDEIVDQAAANGRRTYLGTTPNGPVEIAYVDRDDRDADLLARAVRSLLVQSPDEERLAIMPTGRVEHEALVTYTALAGGVSVPGIEAIAYSERDSALIALDAPTGAALAELADSDIDDAHLDALWHELGALHDAGLAHRALTLENLRVDSGGAQLAGLSSARLSPTAEQRATDIAELAITTALAVGPERAIEAAIRSGRSQALEAGLAFMQRSALPATTRKRCRAHKGLVDEVRTGLQNRLGIAEVELPELDRLDIARVVTWVGFMILAFFLLTLITSWSEISESLKGLDWGWIPAILATALVSTFGGAMALAGSVLRRVPLGEATLIMFGQSFLNRFTPMNAGGMAMRIRYLQKGGTDVTVATAAIGLASASNGVVQGVLILFFLLWSGTDPTSDVDLAGNSSPDLAIVGVFVGAIVVAAAVIALSPKLRRWLVDFIKSTIDKVRHDFGELARRPSKLALLFGGAAFSKLLTIVAFAMSCRAFGIDLNFAEMGALYLGATTIASAVPTPGGVGAIEAALVLVLTNAGAAEPDAWAAVLLFRLMTYWLPTVPGYVALKISERRDLV